MLNKKQKQKVENFFIHLTKGITIVFFTLAFMVVFATPFYTADDTKFLPTVLEEINTRSVLGASTENKSYIYGCNEDRPIVGWIDYSGNKVIRDILPEGETASACFKNVEEAVKNGFANNE